MTIKSSGTRNKPVVSTGVAGAEDAPPPRQAGLNGGAQHGLKLPMGGAKAGSAPRSAALARTKTLAQQQVPAPGVVGASEIQAPMVGVSMLRVDSPTHARPADAAAFSQPSGAIEAVRRHFFGGGYGFGKSQPRSEGALKTLFAAQHGDVWAGLGMTRREGQAATRPINLDPFLAGTTPAARSLLASTASAFVMNGAAQPDALPSSTLQRMNSAARSFARTMAHPTWGLLDPSAHHAAPATDTGRAPPQADLERATTELQEDTAPLLGALPGLRDARQRAQRARVSEQVSHYRNALTSACMAAANGPLQELATKMLQSLSKGANDAVSMQQLVTAGRSLAASPLPQSKDLHAKLVGLVNLMARSSKHDS